METFSASLALCARKSPVTGEFPSQRPVTRSFDVFLVLRLNKRLSKQSWGWWFETPSRSLWRHRNVNLGRIKKHMMTSWHGHWSFKQYSFFSNTIWIHVAFSTENDCLLVIRFEPKIWEGKGLSASLAICAEKIPAVAGFPVTMVNNGNRYDVFVVNPNKCFNRCGWWIEKLWRSCDVINETTVEWNRIPMCMLRSSAYGPSLRCL